MLRDGPLPRPVHGIVEYIEALAFIVVPHVAIDYILAIFLIAAPFLFGFSGETEPLAFFLALGIAHLLMTIATRFLARDDAAERRRGSAPAAAGEARPAEAPARDG